MFKDEWAASSAWSAYACKDATTDGGGGAEQAEDDDQPAPDHVKDEHGVRNGAGFNNNYRTTWL